MYIVIVREEEEEKGDDNAHVFIQTLSMNPIVVVVTVA